LIFILGNFGFPMIEEVILLIVGYFAYAGIFNLWIAIVVSALGAALADNLAFWCASHGHLFLKHALNSQTLERIRHAVELHGQRTVFLARFVPGMRVLTPWVAGTSGMRWSVFAFANLLGAAVQTPIIILIGFLLGPHVERAIGLAKLFHAIVPWVFLIAFVLAAILVCIHRRSVRRFFLGGANGRI
jgi:membrane protein DedA with SNARE-associated domain